MAVDLLSPEDAKELVKSPKIRDMVEQLDKIMKEGLKCAAGLFDGTNPDASVPMSEASTKTRFGMDLTKQALADRRESRAPSMVLGVLVVRERMQADDWEEYAARVDEEEKNKHAIDVKVEP